MSRSPETFSKALILGLVLSFAAALPAQAANVIVPRAWVLVNECGGGLVDVRGDHGYSIALIDGQGEGKPISVEGRLEKRRFLVPRFLHGLSFIYVPVINPPADQNVYFRTTSNGQICKDVDFRATTRLRWQIVAGSPHMTVNSPWRDRNCNDDWQPPPI